LTALPPFRPRLIGLDLDGTILGAQGELSDAMLDALLACRDAGIELAFLTGRRPTTARAGLARYLDRAHVSTNSGSLLWNYPDWESIADARLFPKELLQDVCELLDPWSLNLYADAGPHDAGRILFARRSTPEFELAQRLYGIGQGIIHDFAELDGMGEITQVALPGPRELCEQMAERVIARYPTELLTLVVRWPLVPCHGVELFHPEANKGSALAHFAQRLAIPQAEVMAVGDDTNDLAMLRWAGWGVAMPHAESEVRGVAQAVLTGEDGQAVLAQYLFNLVSP
jgi:hydroxymethylpyrimidine pyrophosphatase-like HAD family hydrolase